MKMSTRGRYGLRSLLDLSMQPEDCVSLSEIAARQDISFNYLESIFSHLRRASIVIGVAGSSGGYKLVKPADKLTLYEILTILEGDLSIIGAENEEESEIRSFLRSHVWQVIDQNIEAMLKNTTLEDVKLEYRKQEDSNECAGL